MQEVADERGGYLHGRGVVLDSNDVLYLKEQMEAEEDAKRLPRRTGFSAFKISFIVYCLLFSNHDFDHYATRLRLLNMPFETFFFIFLHHKSQSCNPNRFISSICSLATSC